RMQTLDVRRTQPTTPRIAVRFQGTMLHRHNFAIGPASVAKAMIEAALGLRRRCRRNQIVRSFAALAQEPNFQNSASDRQTACRIDRRAAKSNKTIHRDGDLVLDKA